MPSIDSWIWTFELEEAIIFSQLQNSYVSSVLPSVVGDTPQGFPDFTLWSVFLVKIHQRPTEHKNDKNTGSHLAYATISLANDKINDQAGKEVFSREGS